jgi:L-asparagine transporter-like permease
MLFTQAREGNFPRQLARTNPRRKVPTAAIAITASCTFIGAVLAYFYPASAYVFIASLSTFGFLFAWLMIAISQPLYRLKMGAEWVRNLKWKTPLYPLTPIIAIVTVLGALVGQFFTGGSGNKIGPVTIPGGGLAVVVGVIWTVAWSVYYLAYARRAFSHGAEWRSREDAVAAESVPQADPLPADPVAE